MTNPAASHTSQPTIIKCPQCGEDSIWSKDNISRPFCSERCKLIDLGAWASEEYQVAAVPEEMLED